MLAILLIYAFLDELTSNIRYIELHDTTQVLSLLQVLANLVQILRWNLACKRYHQLIYLIFIHSDLELVGKYI